MRLLGGKDLYRLSCGRSLSDADLSRAANCYLPLIGATGMGVYAYLHSQVQLYNGNRFFDSAFNETSLNPDQFSAGLGLLEGVGLVRTFVDKSGDQAYLLIIYPSLSYKGFFENDVLSRKLKETLGFTNYNLLKSKLLVEAIDASGYKEVSSSFAEAFYDKDENRGITYSFDKSKFADGFLERGFQLRMLSDDEVRFCASMSEFYLVDSAVAGQTAAESLAFSNPFGQKLDRKLFEEKISYLSRLSYLRKPTGEAIKSPVGNNSQKAEAIRLFDNMTPQQFLSFRQGTGRVGPSDLKLIKTLTQEMGLSNPACNALLAFVLDKNDNSLPFNYSTKLAGVVARNGLKTSRDTMEFLLNQNKKNKQSQKAEWANDHKSDSSLNKHGPEFHETESGGTEKDHGDVNTVDKKISDEELRAALKKIYGDDDDD